jgi:pimeloyl-ACP methyl ester carboxylesterase
MPHVTFVHGIGNKPAAEALADRWERSLAAGDGLDLGTLGVTSRMVYWSDVLYPEPAEEDLEACLDLPSGDIGPVTDIRPDLAGPEREWADRFATGLGLGEEGTPAETAPGTGDLDLERVPLPHALKRRLMETLLRDVHHYLFDTRHAPRPEVEYRVQDEIRRRTIEALREGAEQPGPHVLLTHSMGTVIAYDCLKRVPDCPPVDALVTMGSPLGRHEIPEELRPGWSRDEGFPAEKLRGPWVNVFDRLDVVVGAYPHLKFGFRRHGETVVEDVNEQSWGRWRHDVAKYLQGPELRRHLAGLLGI